MFGHFEFKILFFGDFIILKSLGTVESIQFVQNNESILYVRHWEYIILNITWVIRWLTLVQIDASRGLGDGILGDQLILAEVLKLNLVDVQRHFLTAVRFHLIKQTRACIVLFMVSCPVEDPTLSGCLNYLWLTSGGQRTAEHCDDGRENLSTPIFWHSGSSVFSEMHGTNNGVMSVMHGTNHDVISVMHGTNNDVISIMHWTNHDVSHAWD